MHAEPFDISLSLFLSRRRLECDMRRRYSIDSRVFLTTFNDTVSSLGRSDSPSEVFKRRKQEPRRENADTKRTT